ncbi:hypothetical protein NIES3275_34840 [Microchaete diplosiphon NIES-3275]|nr:hypothetical protein NIES3275_34840 [Microchaete diplosiphon NIES-3275]
MVIRVCKNSLGTSKNQSLWEAEEAEAAEAAEEEEYNYGLPCKKWII